MGFSRQEYRVDSHLPLQGTEFASFSSVAQSCPTLHGPIDCSTPGLPVHHQLPEFVQTHLVVCRPLLLLPSISPSIRVFSSESALCIRWPEYWSFSFSVCPSNECARLIFFRIYLLAVQGTLKNLLQHHNSKASILYHSAIFMGQLPHSYMTTGKP